MAGESKSEDPWKWDAQTEARVSRNIAMYPYDGGSRCDAIRWHVTKAAGDLGKKSNSGMIAAAVVYHLFRKR